jgi:hypothetical protein
VISVISLTISTLLALPQMRSVTYTLKLAGELVRRTAKGTMMPKPIKMTAMELMMMPSSTIPEYVSLLQKLPKKKG